MDLVTASRETVCRDSQSLDWTCIILNKDLINKKCYLCRIMIENLFQVVPNDLTKQSFIFLLYVCVYKLKNKNDHNGSVVISITIFGLGSPRGPGRPKGNLRNTNFGVLSLGSSVMEIDGFILKV